MLKNNFFVFLKYYMIGKKYPERNRDLIERYFVEEFNFGYKRIMNAQHTNEAIYDLILSKKPFMAGRYGSGELFMMAADEFSLFSHYIKYLKILCKNGGFFPCSVKAGHQFVKLMRESSLECDVFACWFNMYEEYFMRHYLKKEAIGTFLFNFEPWSYPKLPWTMALENKKVLVIHPFAETIKKQYSKRKLIWGSYNILPEFELLTLKSVQTIAGQKDPRFNDWFEALDWMFNESMKIDFDIAIIGCGAYGFPLATRIKKAGKQAVHLAGATQILFGIKGKRWEEDPAYEYVRNFFNEYWVYPSSHEKPLNAATIENGCYW